MFVDVKVEDPHWCEQKFIKHILTCIVNLTIRVHSFSMSHRPTKIVGISSHCIGTAWTHSLHYSDHCRNYAVDLMGVVRLPGAGNIRRKIKERISPIFSCLWFIWNVNEVKKIRQWSILTMIGAFVVLFVYTKVGI